MAKRLRPNPFPGDHAQKQTARLFLYRYATTAPVRGHAVTLAGSDPESEVELLKNYLKWPGNQTWFVDKDESDDVQMALGKIRRIWSDAHVVSAELADVVRTLPIIGFANLDFMGAPLTGRNMHCLAMVIEKLLPGAILGVTWIRGRECLDTHRSAQLLYDLGKGHKGNARRWAGFLRAMEMLSGGSLQLLDRLEYQSNHSPMAVAVFRQT